MASMASSSKRLTRSHVKKGKSKSFRTTVYPSEDRIELSPKFALDWKDRLECYPYAMLLHPSGNTAVLELHINEDDCFVTSGKMVSVLFGFKEPVEVIVDCEFEEYDICFKLRKFEETEVIDLLSDDEAVDDVVVDNTYTLHEFENDHVFGWEMTVSPAYASTKKPQVLHIPPRMAESVLRGRDSIVLRTRHNMDCTIKTYVRETKPEKKEKKEMYLTKGWFEFKKANRLREGDKLQFQLSDPPNVMVVDIIRRRSLKKN